MDVKTKMKFKWSSVRVQLITASSAAVLHESVIQLRDVPSLDARLTAIAVRFPS